MKTIKLSPWLLMAATLLVGIVMEVLPQSMASAAQITSRSITLQAGASAGGSAPGGSVNHQFSFTLPSSGTLGSIQFQYCTTAASVPGGTGCVTPTGLSTTSATLGTNSGATFTSLNNTNNGAPYVTRTPASFPGGNVVVQLLGVTNPTTPNQTFFVRISSFATSDASGSPTDTGSVAASTANPIILTGTMPESLVFCTGATVGLNAGGVPDCTTATAGNISFNQLFSPSDTATATSQMAASTNAGSGYAITVNGATMTSGSNTISGMSGTGGTATSSVHGASQFGLNLVANTTATASSFPGTSANVAPTQNGTTYTGSPSSNYGTADNFKFVTGDPVANSTAGSNAQIYTSSYIVNVPGNQPAGTYTTTLTYICTGTF